MKKIIILLLLFVFQCNQSEQNSIDVTTFEDSSDVKKVDTSMDVEDVSFDIAIADKSTHDVSTYFEYDESEQIEIGYEEIAEEEMSFDYTLDIVPIKKYQRGPVKVLVQITGKDITNIKFKLFYSIDNKTFIPATLFTNATSVTDQTAILFWNSYADLSEDADVFLKVSAQSDAGTLTKSLDESFKLLNAPDYNRLLVTTHSINTGDQSIQSVHLFNVDKTGVASNPDIQFDVSDEPDRVVFHPSGRYFYVLAQNQSQTVLEYFNIKEDGTVLSPITYPVSIENCTDLDFSLDGGTLYIVSQGTDKEKRGIYAFSINQDGKPGEQLFHTDINNPQALTVYPDNERMFVLAGVLYGSYPFELILSSKGEILSESNDDLGSNEYGAVISNDAKKAVLLSDSLFDQRLSLLSLDDNSFSVSDTIEFGPAVEVVLVGDVAVVSRGEKNKVTFFDIGKGTLKNLGELDNFSMATTMDAIKRGALSGRIFVSCVNKINFLQVKDDKTYEQIGEPFKIGQGVANIIKDIAIQP